MSRPKAIVIVPTGRPVPPIEALSTEADLVVVRTADELRAAQPGAQILFLNDFRSNLLREVGPGELRWIHTSSIGVDALQTEEIVHSDIVVTNSRGVCERPIAEWILGVIVMFTKDLRRTIELQQERVWLHRETEPVLGRRVLVVGPGPVGRETALLLRAAGMEVTVVGRSARDDDELGRIESIDHLDDLLGKADDVVLTLPLTDDTRGLFDAERIARMRVGARLINVGRGAVVVESDLLAAIDSGHLGGAASTSSNRSRCPRTTLSGAGTTSWCPRTPPVTWWAGADVSSSASRRTCGAGRRANRSATSWMSPSSASPRRRSLRTLADRLRPFGKVPSVC